MSPLDFAATRDAVACPAAASSLKACAKAARWAARWTATIAFATGVAAADEPGEVLFNNSCRTCHTVDQGDNRLGPSLAGIVGRKAGALPGYQYSDGMVKSGVVWDEATLDRFIADPLAVVPGNNMKPFSGVASAQDRAAIIAYLKAH